MKRLFSALICVVFLMSGCASTATEQANAPRTPDSLAMAYAAKLTDNGFFMQPEEVSTGQGIHTYGVFSSTLGLQTHIWFVILDRAESIYQVELDMYHHDKLSSDIDVYTNLMQMLVQVCDTVYEKNDKGAQKFVRTIFQSEAAGEHQEEHGLTYKVYGDSQSLNFRVYYPGSPFLDDESPEELAGKKPFDLNAQALLDELSPRFEREQFFLERVKTGVVGIAELALRPVDGDPAVYAVVHALGITVGWLILYTTEAGLVQVDLVNRDDGDRLLYLVKSELCEQLVLACDPVMRQEDTEENQKKAHDIESKLFYHDPIVENGIMYQESIDWATYNTLLTVTVAK